MVSISLCSGTEQALETSVVGRLMTDGEGVKIRKGTHHGISIPMERDLKFVYFKCTHMMYVISSILYRAAHDGNLTVHLL